MVPSKSLFGWIGPKTLVQPHEWTAFLLRRVAVHIYHLTTANLLKSRTPIITGVTPIIACLTSETQQNRLLACVWPFLSWDSCWKRRRNSEAALLGAIESHVI